MTLDHAERLVTEMSVIIFMMYRRCVFLDEFIHGALASLPEVQRSHVLANTTPAQDPSLTKVPSYLEMLHYATHAHNFFDPNSVGLEALKNHKKQFITFINAVIAETTKPAPAPQPAESSAES